MASTAIVSIVGRGRLPPSISRQLRRSHARDTARNGGRRGAEGEIRDRKGTLKARAWSNDRGRGAFPAAHSNVVVLDSAWFYYQLSYKFFSACQRSSAGLAWHWHATSLRLAPQTGQIPLHPSRQTLCIGSASRICSLITSARSRPSPS